MVSCRQEMEPSITRKPEAIFVYLGKKLSLGISRTWEISKPNINADFIYPSRVEANYKVF